MCLDLYLCANTYFFVRVPTKKYPILREPTVPRKRSFQLRLRRNRTPPYAVMLFSINIRGGDRTRNLPIRSRTRYPFRHTDCRGLRPPTTPNYKKQFGSTFSKVEKVQPGFEPRLQESKPCVITIYTIRPKKSPQSLL